MRIIARRDGFSIVELMVALAILAFGIYGAADLIRSSHHTAALADGRVTGSSLGQLKFTEISNAPGLISIISGLKKEPDGSVLYPAEGPAVFDQNKGYVWRAAFKSSTDAPQRISTEITVSRNEDGKAGDSLYVTKGTILGEPGNRAS